MAAAALPVPKRKIVVFGPALDAVSGVTTHVRMLFASDLTHEFDLTHFQVGSEGRNENAAGKLARLLISPFQLALLLLRTHADAVHLNASLDPKGYWRDLVYWMVARSLGCKVVNQIHGGAMPGEFFAGNELLTELLRRFLVDSEVVTVLSRAELAAYRAFDARINVHLVPNAVEAAGLADCPREYNRHRPLRLVYVGRLVRAKGLFETVDALAALQRAGRTFRFYLAGSGPDRAALEAAVREANLAHSVRFLGGVFGAAKQRLWLHADVFLLPSYMEGLPYSLLEAMAAGCVPIATRVAAIPDVMQEAEHGLFVPARDAVSIAEALMRLDDDRAALERMGRAARRRVVDHYTVERLARDFRRLYRGYCA